METGTQASTIAMFFARLLPMFGMFYVAISRLMTPARQQFKDLTTRAAQYDEAALAGFQGDLASVGIGMGVEVPAVEVVAVPTPTAFAFKERCADRIAVTPTLLGAGLSQAEREAVMAHELAHTVDGDGLLEPSVWRGATGIAFIAAPLIVMMTGILGG
jgi:Zn-dependent protease with chaperone function